MSTLSEASCPTMADSDLIIISDTKVNVPVIWYNSDGNLEEKWITIQAPEAERQALSNYRTSASFYRAAHKGLHCSSCRSTAVAAETQAAEIEQRIQAHFRRMQTLALIESGGKSNGLDVSESSETSKPPALSQFATLSMISTPHSTLPAGHFLSLPPSYAGPSVLSPSTSSILSGGLAPNTASLASADFDVDVRTGFLPGSKNVERLPAYWEIWEEALDAARGTSVGDGLMVGGQRPKELLWRAGIEGMVVLETEDLQTDMGLMRRAHLVLSFLLHFYAHTFPSTAPRPLAIPPSIAIPILQIAPKLGLPPILTYSDTVLYNFLPVRPDASVSIANQPDRALVTFTNTRSEEQFYIISAQCEIAGAEALRIMRQSLDELFVGDDLALRRLAVYLRKLAKQIDRVGDITLSMIQHIDPEEFYHLIRPWFKGGDDGPGSLGWAFMGAQDVDAVAAAENTADRAEGQTRGRLFSGPSAGQSSLIHAIDIFLTVDHSPQTPEEQAVNESSFLQRMLQYMPLPHRTFLGHLADHPTPLRPVITHYAATHPKLAAAYDLALDALKRFREKHMRIVSVFIVQQARRQPSERIRGLLGMEGEAEEEEVVVELGEMRGTGGSPLFKFLKRCRDNTTRAMIAGPTGSVYELK